MINGHVIQSILPLVDKLDTNNVNLEVLAETPLARAIDACYTPRLEEHVEDVAYLLSEPDVQEEGSVAISHDETMQSIVAQVSKTVGDNITLARSVVVPQIKQVLSDLGEYLDSRELRVANFLTVVPRHYPSVWSSPVLESMVEKYDNRPVKNLDIQRVYPEKTPEEIITLMKTGVTRFDKELEAFIADVGHELVERVYNEVFKRPDVGEEAWKPAISEYISRNGRAYNETLIIHLIARRYLQDTPEEVPVSLDQHRNYMSELVEVTGIALCRVLVRREQALSRKDMNIEWPLQYMLENGDEVLEIVVNGDVYNQWLKDGGCPEILFGAAVSGKNGLGYNDLIENREILLNAWERQLRIRTQRLTNDRLTYVTSGTRAAVQKMIRDTADEDLPIPDRSTLNIRLVNELAELKLKDLDCLPALIRRIVCRTLWAHTETENILTRMDEIGEQNPEMEMREVALLATIDLVSDWVGCMFRVRA